MNAQTGQTDFSAAGAGGQNGTGATSDAAASAPAPGQDGMMAGELGPFVADPSLPDQSEFIMDTLFGQSSNGAPKSQGQGAGTAGAGQSGDASQAASVPAAPGANAAQGTGGASTPPAAGTAQPQQGQQPQQPQQSGVGMQPLPPLAQPAGGQQQSPTPGQQPGTASPQAGNLQTGQPAIDPLAELRLQVQTLTAQNASLQQYLRQGGPQQGGQAGTGIQPGNMQPQQPDPYDPKTAVMQLQVPADVLGAIDSEDPNQRAQGMNHLVSAVATTVLRQALTASHAVIDQRLQGFGADLEARNEDERIKADYYGAFPQHNNPLFADLIASESRALFQSTPGLQWSPEARNALGARVNAKLIGLGVNVNALAQPTGQQPGFSAQPTVPTAPMQQQGNIPPEAGPIANGGALVSGKDGNATVTGNRPAAMMGAGTRPPQEESVGNFMVDTLRG